MNEPSNIRSKGKQRFAAALRGHLESAEVGRARLEGYDAGVRYGLAKGEERERRRHEPRGSARRMLVGLALGAWLVFGAGVAVGQCSAIAAGRVEVSK